MDCIFCKIINNEIPSYTVYEDDIAKIILDINPINDGHMLILPKKHFKDISDIDLDTLSHINLLSKKMNDLLKEKLNVEGLTIVQNNGCGQLIKHYHMHLIPRNDNDGLDFKNIAKLDVKEIYEKLK